MRIAGILFLAVSGCTITIGADEVQRDLVRRVGSLEEWQRSVNEEVPKAFAEQAEAVSTLRAEVEELRANGLGGE